MAKNKFGVSGQLRSTESVIGQISGRKRRKKNGEKVSFKSKGKKISFMAKS